MTTWPEEGNSSEDEFEFYDPTAPAAGGHDELDPSRDDTEARADDGGRDRTPERDSAGDDTDDAEDGARTDPGRTVHVTLDDDKRVVAVRVSNRWRERVKRDKTTLAEVVLKVISGNQAMAGAPLWSPPSVEHASASPLNGASLDRLLEQSVTLDEEAATLRAKDDVRPTRFTGEDVDGWSANRKVHVRIDRMARTCAIDIDDEWVKQSRADQTGDAILQAHQDAYARWTPPEVEPGEWDLLNSERTAIRDEIMAMFRNGI